MGDAALTNLFSRSLRIPRILLFVIRLGLRRIGRFSLV